jgi:hypothetical protein
VKIVALRPTQLMEDFAGTAIAECAYAKHRCELFDGVGGRPTPSKITASKPLLVFYHAWL